MRIFLGIDFDEGLKARLALVQRGLQERAKKGSFTRPENFHLTVRFLGEQDEEVVEQIQREMIETVADVPAFELVLSGAGMFSKRSGVIPWLGVERSAGLDHLYAAVSAALERCGIPPEERAYTPHLTFGRNVRFQSATGDSFLNMPVPALRQEVRELTLFWSHQVDDTLTYTPLARFPLKGIE